MLELHYRNSLTMLRLIDFMVVCAIWLFSYSFRFYLLPGAQEGLEIIFVKIFIVMVLLLFYFLYANKLYEISNICTQNKMILLILKSNIQAHFVFVSFMYLFYSEKISRIFLSTYFISSTIFLIIFRLIYVKYFFFVKNKISFIIIGHGKQLLSFIDEIKLKNFHIGGWIDSNNQAAQYNLEELDSDSLENSSLKNMSTIFVVSYPTDDNNKLEIISNKLENLSSPVLYLPDISTNLIGHKIEDFFHFPFIALNRPNITMTDFYFKRLFDIFVSCLALIFISPFLLIISLLIKLTSRGPVFYKQKRMGLYGEEFYMWKFRTMKMSQNNAGTPGWTVKDDPRRTWIGIILRSTSIDELPQLWNILKGNMSLVGPRPEQPFFVEKFKDQIPGYFLRHVMKTGLTGWAQINGLRGDTSIRKRIEYDLYYIKNWSLWFDLKIIFLTFWKGIINKNAY